MAKYLPISSEMIKMYLRKTSVLNAYHLLSGHSNGLRVFHHAGLVIHKGALRCRRRSFIQLMGDKQDSYLFCLFIEKKKIQKKKTKNVKVEASSDKRLS